MLNTGPHSCIWGGASNYLAPALVVQGLSRYASVTTLLHLFNAEVTREKSVTQEAQLRRETARQLCISLWAAVKWPFKVIQGNPFHG